MNIMTRRQALTRLGATSAALSVAGGAPFNEAQAAGAVVDIGSEELLRLRDLLDDCLAERAAAEAEIDRIADEWRDQWPLAPEELLGGAIKNTAHDDDWWRAERDIAGRVLHRDPSAFSAKMRRRYAEDVFVGPVAFYIQAPASIEEGLRRWTEREPKGRTERALARSTRQRDEGISYCRERLNLVHQYEAEIARLREISGMNAAMARLDVANRHARSFRAAISRAKALTPHDLRIKAEALREDILEVFGDVSAQHNDLLARLCRMTFDVADVIA